MSEPRTFADRLCAAMRSIGAVGKDKRNTFHNYEYTSAAAIQMRVQKALAEHGLYLYEVAYQVLGTETVKDRRGNDNQRVTTMCTLTVSDGQHKASGEGLGCGVDPADKAPMKAVTSSYKYALCSLFCIAMGDDPEADASVDEEALQRVETPEQTAKRHADKELVKDYIADLESMTEEEQLASWLESGYRKTISGLEEGAKHQLWDALQALRGRINENRERGNTFTVVQLRSILKGPEKKEEEAA